MSLDRGIGVYISVTNRQTTRNFYRKRKMNYVNVAVNVKSDDGRKIVIETSEGLWQTYYLAPKRVMYLIGETLQVSMRADHGVIKNDGGVGHSLQLTRQIEGTVILKDQFVSVMGDSRSKSNKLHVVFQTVTPDGRERNQEFETNSSGIPSYTRAWIKCLHITPEYGAGPEWFAVCMVSPDTLDAIASAVASETLRALTVGMIFSNIYILDDDEEHCMDDLRPVQEWYLRPNLDDNMIKFTQDAYGAVTFLDLALGAVKLGKLPSNTPDLESVIGQPSSLAERQLDQLKPTFNLIAASIEKLRFMVLWLGGIIALILLGLTLK